MKKILVTLTLGASLFSLAACGDKSSESSKINELEKELKETKNNLNDVQISLNEVQNNYNDAQKELNTINEAKIMANKVAAEREELVQDFLDYAVLTKKYDFRLKYMNSNFTNITEDIFANEILACKSENVLFESAVGEDGKETLTATPMEAFNSKCFINNLEKSGYEVVMTSYYVVSGYHGSNDTIVIPSYVKETVSAMNGEYDLIPIKEISNQAFKSKGIKHVIIEDGIVNIGVQAFMDNEIETVSFPNTLRAVESGAFRNNKIKNLFFPKSTYVISTLAFQDNQIETVEFEEGCVLFSIGGYAFRNNNIKTITFPSRITGLPSEAFFGNLVETAYFKAPAEAISVQAVSRGFTGQKNGETVGQRENIITQFIFGVE